MWSQPNLVLCTEIAFCNCLLTAAAISTLLEKKTTFGNWRFSSLRVWQPEMRFCCLSWSQSASLWKRLSCALTKPFSPFTPHSCYATSSLFIPLCLSSSFIWSAVRKSGRPASYMWLLHNHQTCSLSVLAAAGTVTIKSGKCWVLNVCFFNVCVPPDFPLCSF